MAAQLVIKSNQHNKTTDGKAIAAACSDTRKGSSFPEHGAIATADNQLGWRADNQDQLRKPLALDEVRMLAKVKYMPFYEKTKNGLAHACYWEVLWVEVKVGA